MFKLCVICVLIICCNAAGNYGGSSGGGGYGGGGYSGGFGGSGPVTAAVQSQHTVEIRHVNLPQEIPQPQVVEVEAGNLPLTIHFKSASSNINVLQSHQPSAPGEIQQTSSEDEPHRLVHEVTKPIIQEVREVITPYRRVIQEIKPVVEEIQTVIAKGEPRGGGLAGGYNGGGLAGGYNGGGLAGGYGGGVSNGGVGAISHVQVSRSVVSSGGGYGASAGGNQVRIIESGGNAAYVSRARA